MPTPISDALSRLAALYSTAANPTFAPNGRFPYGSECPAARREIRKALMQIWRDIQAARVALVSTGYPVPPAWLEINFEFGFSHEMDADGEDVLLVHGWDREAILRVLPQVQAALTRGYWDILELQGPGREIWQGIDAYQHVEQLRREWDDRP